MISNQPQVMFFSYVKQHLHDFNVHQIFESNRIFYLNLIILLCHLIEIRCHADISRTDNGQFQSYSC